MKAPNERLIKLFIQVRYNLGIRIGIKSMALFSQSNSLGLVIIDLTITNCLNRLIFVSYWLVAFLRIDDAEPCKTQCNLTI